MAAVDMLTIPPVPQDVDSELFRNLIGHFATGVTVITAADGGSRYGSTASAVSSLSLEPPMLLVCLNRSSATGQAIDRVGRFAVNILSDEQADLAKHFASRSPDKFATVGVVEGSAGQPLLAEALAYFECRVVERAIGGTHTVLLAAVERGAARPGEPLTYFRGRFGRFVEPQDDEAYRDLRAALLERTGQLGDEFTVSEVAERLGVLRSSAMYALGRVTQVGLVTRRSATHYARTTIDADLIRRTFGARIMLTIGALDAVIDDATERHVEALRRAAGKVPPPAQHGTEPIATYNALCSLYEALLALPGNEIVAHMNLRFSVPALLAAPVPEETVESLHRAQNEAFTGLVTALDGHDRRAAKVALVAYDDLFREACLAALAG